MNIDTNKKEKMNNSSINIKAMEQTKSALSFIDIIEREKDIDKKVKIFGNMMTYYAINANNFQQFCMELLVDTSIYSRDNKLRNKIIELEDIKKRGLI